MSKNVQMVFCLIEKPKYCRVNHTLTHHEVTIRNEETKDIKFTKRQKTNPSIGILILIRSQKAK